MTKPRKVSELPWSDFNGVRPEDIASELDCGLLLPDEGSPRRVVIDWYGVRCRGVYTREGDEPWKLTDEEPATWRIDYSHGRYWTIS